MSLRRSTKDPTYCNPFGLNSVAERVSQDCSLNDAMLPFPDMLPYIVKTKDTQPVDNPGGEVIEMITEYTVYIKNKWVGQLFYAWEIGVGSVNVEILEPVDVYSQTIRVRTYSQETEDFSIDCTVTSLENEEYTNIEDSHKRSYVN